MERLLSGGAPVSVPSEFNKGNELAFRQYVDGEFALVYRKGQNVIIPYGNLLGFAGSTGKTVTFGLNGSDNFTISIDDAAAITLATSGDLSALEASITIDIAEVDGKLTGSFGFSLDVNNRIASLKLLSDGTTSDIVFKADAFEFYDGLTERALISAAGGVFTVNGDIAVSGSIVVGSARLKVGLESLEFSKVDGDTIQWAGGVSVGTAPKYTLDTSALNPLASGEQYDVRLTSVTNTGATVYAKIATPGTTAAQSETTDTAGGVGDPDRVMEKPTSADAYNGVYNFTISGEVNVTSTYDGESGFYLNTGSAVFSTWFDDGGGWDEGPGITVEAYEVVGYFSGSSQTGAQAFEFTYAIDWSAAVGNSGSSGYEFGVSHESGGSLSDLDEVAYTTQTSSGTRSATPNGEKVKIVAFPRNASA